MEEIEPLLINISKLILKMLNNNQNLMNYKNLEDSIRLLPQLSAASRIYYIFYDDIKNMHLTIYTPNLHSRKNNDSYENYSIFIDYFDEKGNPIFVELNEQQKEIIIPILMGDKFYNLSLFLHNLIKPILDDIQITSNKEIVNTIFKNISNRIHTKNKKQYASIFKSVKDLSYLNKKIQYSEELNKDFFNLTKEDKETISLMHDFYFDNSSDNKRSLIYKIVSTFKY